MINYINGEEGANNRLKVLGTLYLKAHNLEDEEGKELMSKTFQNSRSNSEKLGYDVSKHPEKLEELTE